MFKQVDLPTPNFKHPDKDWLALVALDVCLGQQHPDSSEVIVRGVAKMTPQAFYVPFCGVIVVREGRDDVDHDVVFYEPVDDAVKDDIVEMINLALDWHSDVTAMELDRICG